MADYLPKGLLGAFRQYLSDASPSGSLNPEIKPGMPTEAAKGLLGFTPVVGDAISGYDAVQSARQGDYLGAALNGVGMLPFVPSLGYTIHKMGDIKILEEPTREMVKNLADKSRYGEVRGLVDPATNKQYWWDAGSLNHNDVADWFGMKWDDILAGSDKTRKMMKSSSIDGTPWKFAGE